MLPEKAAPDTLPAAVQRFGATVCFTAPTAYRAIAMAQIAARERGEGRALIGNAAQMRLGRRGPARRHARALAGRPRA